LGRQFGRLGRPMRATQGKRGSVDVWADTWPLLLFHVSSLTAFVITEWYAVPFKDWAALSPHDL